MSSEDVIAQLARDFGRIPLEFRQQVRPALKKAADPIVAQAKANAAWSTRIPDAIRAAARLSKKRQGVAIVVSRKKAPHARAFEGLTTRSGTFKHPVFGSETWFEEQTRPFVWPAVSKGRDDVREAVAAAVEKSARAHGWR